MKNEAADAPITFEEIVIVMIKDRTKLVSNAARNVQKIKKTKFSVDTRYEINGRTIN